jgi:uncharacterized protein (DUF885 family)
MEYMMDTVGFYQTELARFGMWSDQAWRAARLVIDTGLHDKKWTREQALQFFLDNTAIARHNAITEVDRYAVWPAQALSYKLGQMEFIRLQEYARAKLGSKFDIRDYHDVVLKQGAVPLVVLKEIVEDWVKNTSANH